MKKTHPIIFFLVVFNLNAQEDMFIELPLQSFESAFVQRDVKAMQALLSEDFTIGIFGKPSNDIMLRSILERYHQLDSLEILEPIRLQSQDKEEIRVSVKYFFKDQKPFISSIVYNADYKILFVDLFDTIYSIDRYASAEKVVTIPFEMFEGSIVLKAKLNEDEEELTMLFDTGADGMALSQVAADKIHLKNVRDHSTNVVGGKVKVKFSSGNTLRLDGLDIPDQNLVVFPTIGKGLDGIIGGSFIRKYITHVNFDSQEIDLYTFGDFDFTNMGEKMEIEFSSVPKLAINAVYNNDKIFTENYVFDTGASYNLITFSAGTMKYDLITDFKVEFSSPTYSGGHSSATRSGNVKSLKIGSYQFGNFNGVVQDPLPNNDPYNQVMGSLGMKMIERFNFTIDLLNRAIYLIPSKNYDKPFDVVIAGVVMVFDAAKENLVVKNIVRGSRAETSQIRTGAMVHSINGISSEELLKTENRGTLHNRDVDVFLITQNNQSLRISI